MILSARLLTPLALATLAVSAQAQSLFAFQGLYEGTASGDFVSSDGHGGANDASSPFTVARDFTGLDRAGNTQTMSVSGTAYSSAEYGKVHVYGQGAVANSYFNAANPPSIDGNGAFDPNGSPYQLAVHGNAGWSDRLTFSGLKGDDYTVNFFFYLDGALSGNTDTGLNFYTDRPNDPFFSPRMPTLDAARQNVGTTWVTPDYKVVDGQGFGITVDFYSGFTANLVDHPDGSLVEGAASFEHTLTLSGVRLFDNTTGQFVTGYTLDSASGFTYPQAVPEPGSLAAVGLGFLIVGRRRVARNVR